MGCMSSKKVTVASGHDAQLKKAKTEEAAGIMAETVNDDAKTKWKNARAQKKFNKLDTDGSGNLEEAELNALAEWVWCSFNPKQVIDEAIRAAEVVKIKEACDKNKDGVIDKDEFLAYYEIICKEIQESHKEKNAAIKAEKKKKGEEAKALAKNIKAKKHAMHMADKAAEKTAKEAKAEQKPAEEVYTSASSSVFTGEAWQCKGEWDEKCKAVFDKVKPFYSHPDYMLKNNPESIAKMRVMLEKSIPKTEAYTKYSDKCEVSEQQVGGPQFLETAAVVKAIIHKVKGQEDSGRKCMIFFHGGGCVVGSAESNSLVSCRYAVEADVTVISIDYRKAPEGPFPSQIHDAYAAIMWVIKNAQSLGIDPAHVGLFGESGGGYVTVGASVMLAERDQSHLIRFHNPQFPMVTDHFTNGDEIEEGPASTCAGLMRAFYDILCPDLPGNKDNVHLYPIKASDDLVKKMSPGVIMTAEFDFLLHGCQALRNLYQKNGILLDYGCAAGMTHSYNVTYTFEASCDAHYLAFKQICDKYL